MVRAKFSSSTFTTLVISVSYTHLGEFVAGTVRLMNAYQIGSVLKHFPGYGDNADTHTGLAVDSRSLQELESNDCLLYTSRCV